MEVIQCKNVNITGGGKANLSKMKINRIYTIQFMKFYIYRKHNDSIDLKKYNKKSQKIKNIYEDTK